MIPINGTQCTTRWSRVALSFFAVENHYNGASKPQKENSDLTLHNYLAPIIMLGHFWSQNLTNPRHTFTTSLLSDCSLISGRYFPGFTSSCSRNTPSDVIFPIAYKSPSNYKNYGSIHSTVNKKLMTSKEPVGLQSKRHPCQQDRKHRDVADEPLVRHEQSICHQTEHQFQSADSAAESSVPTQHLGKPCHVHYLSKKFKYMHV